MKTLFENCTLCPRRCAVNRLANERGVCGESADLRIADIEAHFGEEPPISGNRGSATIFFSGCSLKCCYCQNYQISSGGLGEHVTIFEIVQKLEALFTSARVHNINFVTPDHFLPQTIEIARLARQRAIHIPILYNLSGYQTTDSLKLIESRADIYLPDFKYAGSALAQRYSTAANYPEIAIPAIEEMIRQKGFLSCTHDETDGIELATKGVLVRHLILPGHVRNSLDALTMLFIEFGADLPLSLMSQYQPIAANLPDDLNRQVTPDEFNLVYEHATKLGFKLMYTQFPPRECEECTSEYLPDFSNAIPFAGNINRGKKD
ncbi:radical SAM protein [candidate division KSB1 bacterium]|nr:radical SAM protein [candidate division KSB1 bacterium]